MLHTKRGKSEEYGLDNCKIELIEKFPCSNIEELRRREGYYIKEFDCVKRVGLVRNINKTTETM